MQHQISKAAHQVKLGQFLKTPPVFSRHETIANLLFSMIHMHMEMNVLKHFVLIPSKDAPNDSLFTTRFGCDTIERPLLGVDCGGSMERCSWWAVVGMQGQIPAQLHFHCPTVCLQPLSVCFLFLSRCHLMFVVARRHIWVPEEED